MPGHAGLDGSEDADRLAGEAASEDQPNVPIDLSSVRSAIARQVGTMVDARARAPHPHPALTTGHDDLPRWEACTLSQLRKRRHSRETSPTAWAWRLMRHAPGGGGAG